MNKIIVLVLLWVSINVQALTNVEHPDLSKSATAIFERQKELVFQLSVLSEHDSPYIRSEGYGKMAQFYHVHDFIDVSIQFYNNALELAPSNSKWHYLKAMAYRNQGDFENVKKGLLEAWKYNNEYMPSMVYLAEQYFNEGLLDEARQTYQKVLDFDPNFPRALAGMGQVMMQEGEPEKAIENFKKAIELQPYANQVNFLLSQAYAATGNFEESQKYDKLKGSVQAQMNDPLIQELYSESRSSSYYNDKAIKALIAKDYVSSETWASRALEYEPESPYPKVTLANIYTKTGRTQKAAELLQTVVAENDKDPNLKYSLGAIEEMLGNDDKAVHWYKKTMELDPGHKRAAVTLSSALMRLGNYEEAMKQLRVAVELDPENAHVLHRMASIKAHYNLCDQAETLIYQSIKKQPRNFAFLLTLAKIAVHCQVSDQMVQDALNASRNIYQITQDLYVVETLAMIEAKAGNYDEAIDYQAQAIFQLLGNESKQAKAKIRKLQDNLELYKQRKLPKNLFRKDDVDLNPSSFNQVK